MTTLQNARLAHKAAHNPMKSQQSIPAQTTQAGAIAHNSAGYVKQSPSGASFIFCPFRGGSPEKYFGTKAGAIRHMAAAESKATQL